MAGIEGLCLQPIEPRKAGQWGRGRAQSGEALRRPAIGPGRPSVSRPAVASLHDADGRGRRSAAALSAIAFVALALGLVVYLTDRDQSHATLIPAIGALAGSNLFGALGQWIPSFVHPFAFSLFSAATCSLRGIAGYGACVAWWAVDVAFEVAQHPGLKRAVAEAAAEVLGHSWPARLLSNYVLHGTFDVADLIAATAGAVAAASILCLARRKEVKHA